jgi:hypothetical protein
MTEGQSFPERIYSFRIGFSANDLDSIPKKAGIEELVASQMGGELNEETDLFTTHVQEISSEILDLGPESLAEWFDEEREEESLLLPEQIAKIRFLREQASIEDLRWISNEVLNDMSIYAAIDDAILNATEAFLKQKGESQ